METLIGQKTSLKDITSGIQRELDEFDKMFKDALRSKTPLLDKIMNYIVKTKGKRIRPALVLLSSKLTGGINESSYRAAALVELLHTATLVHDDVVDEANTRRGFFSINALWKNKVAVLAGDYLLSRGLLLALDNEEYHQLQILSNAVRMMSEGELLQLEKARRLDIKEEVYYDVIRQKTASLIAAACAGGASAAGASKESIAAMNDFGMDLGMAFQIKDDLLDYGNGSIGKPKAIDIKEKKMTLPLIYCLQNASPTEKSKMLNVVKHHNQDGKKVRSLIQKVYEMGGISYAENKMQEYADSARVTLRKMPDNEARTSLLQLIDFVIHRKK